MILDMVHETDNLLKSYTDTLTQKNQEGAIQNTYEEINRLEKNLTSILNAYRLRKYFLPDDIDQISYLQNELISIKTLLVKTKPDFVDNKNYNQLTALDNIQNSVNRVANYISRAWMIYVQSQIQPYQELANIAETLPQMKAKIVQVNNLIRQLEVIEQKIPNHSIWSDFTSKKQQLAILLDNLQGLDEAKRQFLHKVRTKSAFVSDLTPDLLRWCKEQGISSSLVVRFIDRA